MLLILKIVVSAAIVASIIYWIFLIVGVIIGFESITKPCNVEVISDSKYVIDAFNQHWIEGWIKKGWKRGKNEPVKNVDLWKRLLEAKKIHKYELLDITRIPLI